MERYRPFGRYRNFRYPNPEDIKPGAEFIMVNKARLDLRVGPEEIGVLVRLDGQVPLEGELVNYRGANDAPDSMVSFIPLDIFLGKKDYHIKYLARFTEEEESLSKTPIKVICQKELAVISLVEAMIRYNLSDDQVSRLKNNRSLDLCIEGIEVRLEKEIMGRRIGSGRQYLNRRGIIEKPVVEVKVGDVIPPVSLKYPMAVWASKKKTDGFYAKVFHTKKGIRASSDYTGYRKRGLIVFVDRQPKAQEKIKITQLGRGWAKGVIGNF